MTDDLRCSLAVANITENTRETGEDYPSQFGSLRPRALADCIVTLAAEVRRLRAAVEAVRGLPIHHEPYRDYIDRDDVLAILEGDDGR